MIWLYTVCEQLGLQLSCGEGGGKAVDLVASKDGKRIAIEIETGKSEAGENVRKCKQAGFNRVVSVHTKK